MGITGLLPVLKPIQKQKHLSEFAGQTLAVDAYVWLHRGAYACAVELATNKPTKRYVDYCMHRVRLLRYHKIQPFIVFDGGPLPAKQGTEKEREKKREENMAKANALAAQGKQNQARDYYVKCVDVTPQMAYQVIKVRVFVVCMLHSANLCTVRHLGPRMSHTLWLLMKPTHRWRTLSETASSME